MAPTFAASSPFRSFFLLRGLGWLLLLLGLAALLGLGCNSYSRATPDEEELTQGWQPKAPTLSELQARLKVLVKDSLEASLISLSPDGIRVYANADQQEADSPEVIVYAHEYLAMGRMLSEVPADSMVRRYLKKGSDSIRTYWLQRAQLPPRQLPPRLAHPERPLQGWRIAVDPGHISGSLAEAEVEGKFVKMRPSAATQGQGIGFWEADLTLATAYLVRDELKALGAEVILTRGSPGLSVQGKSFAAWKADHWPQAARDSAEAWEMTPYQLNFWLNRAEDKAIFRSFYNAEDLRRRAELINLFRPHCTLIIHYNVHGPNWELRDEENYMPPADTNYLMAFVPGSFLAGELETAEDRAHVLRLLLTDDWRESYRLGQAWVRRSQQHTAVPPVPVENGLAYLNRSSVYVGEPGLYARNLTLTRLVRGPLVYGESLNQDYLGEALRLNQRDTVVHDILVSKRVQDVADAYVDAVLDFAGR